MRKLKIIFQIVLVVISIATIVLAQISYKHLERGAKYSGLKINIDDTSKVGFIDRRDVITKVSAFNLKKGVTSMQSIPLQSIEMLFKSNPYVNSVEVYGDVAGNVTIDLAQFIPRMRIIDRDGFSYFMDDNHKVVSQRHYVSIQLPVVTQSSEVIPLQYLSSLKRIDHDSLNTRQALAYKRMDLLYDFLEKLEDDDLWKSLFSQVNINSECDVELIPRIGSHIVVFCNIDSLDECDKYFDKLSRFYKSETNNGLWSQYSKVNLKYEDQIVCKKIK